MPFLPPNQQCQSTEGTKYDEPEVENVARGHSYLTMVRGHGTVHHCNDTRSTVTHWSFECHVTAFQPISKAAHRWSYDDSICCCSVLVKVCVWRAQINTYLLISKLYYVPSVLWRCWLGGRKGIRPVKNRVVGYWCGYLSGARCRLAYGPADATATHCLLLQ